MNDEKGDKAYQKEINHSMKKNLIEVEGLEAEYFDSLQNLPASFSHGRENEQWEQEVVSQIYTNSSNIQTNYVEKKEVLIDYKSNFMSELAQEKCDPLSEMLGNNCRSQIVSPVLNKPSWDSVTSKSFLPKNDHPSFFVHENFFKKQASQSSQAVCRKLANAHLKFESSQRSQTYSSESLSRLQCVTQSSNANGSPTGNELKNSHFKSESSVFQQASSSNSNKLISDVNISLATQGSNQFISQYGYEFFAHQQSNIYKLHCESQTEFHKLGYDSISESDDDEEEEEETKKNSLASIGYTDYPSFTLLEPGITSDNSALLSIQYDLKSEKTQLILHKIALELLTTERTYVGILHLLDQNFAFRVDQENRAHNMFPQEIVSQMFTNLKSLYKLHHDFLLPQLEERISSWEKERRIGDIMKNFAPFLKMYTEYVKNYNNSMNLVNFWYQKHPRFAQIMDELHALKECKFLTLQHHMLTPVQRVPRYQLLLKDYLKKLPDDSADKLDAEKALELVSIAANHSNETIKKIDKFKKLLEIQEIISGVVDLVSPSRELLKEGKIVKISARSGDHQERYLFLFSDLVLLCNHRLIPNKVVSGPCFRVRARLNVEDLLVEEGDNLETANTFYIRTTGRVIELYTPTHDEKAEWIKILTSAVTDLLQKKSSLKVGNQEVKVQDVLDLGTKAPKFVKLDSVSHCMSCSCLFSTFAFRRKHHCHACGIVACNKCLTNKVQLSYEGHKLGRVCNSCFDILVKDSKDDRPKIIDSPQRQKGILDVNPNDISVVSGYLQLKARSRFWVRRWFALHDDFVLYSFNSHVDEMALTSMPVPGFTIGMPDKGDNIDGRDNVFKLFHKKKIYYFQTTDESELQRWFIAMEKASKAETIS